MPALRRSHRPALDVAAPAARRTCAHTARLALRGRPRPPAAALWHTARAHAGPGRPACSAPSHRICLSLLLAVASHRSHCAPSGAATQLLLSLTFGCSHVWACLACLVLTLARKATPKVPVTSPRRSLAGQAAPTPNQCAGPIRVTEHIWWSSGRTASSLTGHCCGGTREGRQFKLCRRRLP